MSATQTVLLPGDSIDPSELPASKKTNKALTIGPGLRYTPPSTISSAVAGALYVDARKPALWTENNGGRYIPSVGDTVIATIHHGSADSYMCTITPYTPFATLPNLSFEGATRKTRPILAPTSLVYARVTSAHPSPPHQDPIIECFNPSTGKSEGLGPLKGGMVFDVSLGFARRLLMSSQKGKIEVLDGLAETGVRFEVAVGRNGVVWVEGDGGDVKTTVAVGRALQQCDQENLTVEEQKALIEKVSKSLK